MNLKRVTLMLMSLVMVAVMISAVSAESENANDTLKDVASQSFSDNLDTSNATVYLPDKVYTEHDITINRSARIIGSNDTVFEGKSQNSLFTITGNAQVTFENIKFNNFIKQSNGAVFDIKKSCSVILINCTFTNNSMAINNRGSLEIYDSYFYNNSLTSQNSHGGAISNDGKLYVENTIFTNSYGPRYSNGATIYNNGEMTLNNSTISNAYAAEDSKGSAIFNNNLCLLTNSIIENNMVERYNFNYMHGVIYNQGNLTAVENIFRNNSGKYVKPNTWYEGSPNIYNVGNINLTYNAFIGNVYFKGLSVDVFNNGARYISLERNWWQTNENPIEANRINEGNTIDSWVVLDITPEYSALNINDSALISAGFRLNDGSKIQSDFFSSFAITLFDGEGYWGDSFIFNRTQKKGQYAVTASVCNFTKSATVDVGKIPVYVGITTDANITFPDDVRIDFTSNVNRNVTVSINDEKYQVTIRDGRASLTIRNMNAGTYDLSVVYEGDEDHFRAFNSTKVTVNRMPVALTLENVSDIRADEQMTAVIILNPNVSPVTAELFINGVFNKTIYLYDALNNLTFKNLRQGSYMISVSIAGGENYFSANASKTFHVGRYDPKLNISVEDILLGENATARISAYNFTGNVVLSVNGVSTTVFISNDTNITIPNLEGGLYSASVIFDGDSLYLPSNSTATFRVIRNNPEFNVEITREDKRAHVHVSANESCTGQIGLFVNFVKYYQNLTRGKASFDVGLDSGTNYIFVFFEGDRNFENATYNTTVIIDEEFTIVGEDTEAVEYNNFTYSIVLVEKNRITMPNRNVTIVFDGQIYNVVTDRNGVAGITLNLASGTYTITASYLGRTVTNKISVKSIDYDLKTEDIEFGETESVEVIFNANVTGFVSFKIGNITQNVQVSGSRAQLNISDLSVGRYGIKATYFNDVFTSKTVGSAFEVKKATPRFDIKADNILPGEVEKIEITPLNGFKGNITVSVDGKNYPIEINGSIAVLSITNLEIGVHNLSITAQANENFTDFTYSGIFSVRNRTSAIFLNIANSYFGEDAVINAVLDSDAGGKITFRVSDKSATVDVIDGQAKCIFKGLGAGTYRVDAEYEGDLKFAHSSAYGFFRVLKANSTISIITDEVELGQNIMIYAVVSPNATGKVYFSMVGYYSPRAKQIENASAFWYISPLEAGKYTVIASYTGDANYNPANATFILKVSKTKSILSVSINDASINDRVTTHVKLNDIDGEAISGNVVLKINNRQFTIKVNKGSATFVIGKMNPGSYMFQAVYEGDDSYSTGSTGGRFIVAENLLESNLTAGDIVAYYKGEQDLKLTLTSNGKAISQATLRINVNSRSYIVTTDNSGKVSLNLNLAPGKYVANVSFEETLSHQAALTTASITVHSTINATDVLKLYGTGTQYFALFYAPDGSALGNTEVSFTLNGKVYKVKTLPNGVVRLNININPGTYKITAKNPSSGEKVSNKVRIYAKIMGNKDLTQYYGASKTFKVRIYNASTGNPVGKGQTVKFKVNGKTHKAKTDRKGYASLKINLKAGKYKITTVYDAYNVSNRIVVKSVLSAKNIIGKNVRNLKFKVKLVNKNGKALKGKTIKFKFRGKAYKAKTNRKGIATLAVKNLKVGKYKIKSVYGKSSITRSIKIIK